MASRIKENKRFIIVSSLLIIFILGTIGLNYFLYSKNQKLNKQFKNISLELKKQKDNLKDKINEKGKINEKINIVNNIDENISKIEKEYYKAIKQLEDEILNGESDKKIAYLTFDDGPYYTSYKFLEVLDKYNVKATFFTIGLGKESCFDNRSYDCRQIYSVEASKGHTMANHTYSHQIFAGLYNSPQSFIEQVKTQEKLIKDKTGQTTNIVRFPGGSASARTHKEEIMKLLRDNGYGWVDWTAQDGDGKNLSSKEEAWNIFTKSIDENIEVVLMHDYSDITLSILPDAIEYLQNNGYILLPLFYESNMVNK